jgi:hypothetical protein
MPQGGSAVSFMAPRTRISYSFNPVAATYSAADAACKSSGTLLVTYYQDLQQVGRALCRQLVAASDGGWGALRWGPKEPKGAGCLHCMLPPRTQLSAHPSTTKTCTPPSLSLPPAAPPPPALPPSPVRLRLSRVWQQPA